MVKTLYTVLTDSTDPYYNLALEEVLLSKVNEDICILYLWQNHRTVVIGRNQNAWAECRTALLQEDGGHLARRLSGGGAVYHDLGNLNFTFLCSDKNYDLQKQLSVIQKATLYAGIDSRFSGRNDLLADGKKFSGNAFYHSKGKAYHHGTLLIDTDFSKLEQYLSPPKAKLQSKGIASVRSRVINLKTLSPALTCDVMKGYMVQAFSEIYGGTAESLDFTEADKDTAVRLQRKYGSEEWLFGNPIPFSCNLEGRLPFGSIQLLLQVEAGMICDLQVYTDAMNTELSAQIRQTLLHCPFRTEAMVQAVSQLNYADALRQFILDQNL